MKKSFVLIFYLFFLLPLAALEFDSGEELTVFEPEIQFLVQNEVSELYFRANVSEARIYLNGEYQGTTNLLLKGLIPAEYYLKVEKEGYRTQILRIKAVKNTHQDYYFTLEKLAEEQ